MMSLAVPTLAAAAPVPESCNVTALEGILPPSEGSGSRAEGINDRGEVAGSRSDEEKGYQEAVIWDNSGNARELDELPGGSYGNVAYDINNAGQAVGVAHETHDHPREDFGEFAFQHAVTWDKNGVVTDLPLLPGIDELGGQAEALAINDAGTIAGWASGPPIEEFGDLFHGDPQAVIWTPTPGGGYTITKLEDLPGTQLSEAADINNQGQVVGYALINFSPVAVTWDREGNVTQLPVPDGARGVQATAINNKGQIVGNARIGSKGVVLVWTPAPSGGYTVSVIETDYRSSGANDINDAGVIAGLVSPNAARQTTAAIFTPTRGGGYRVTELCHLPGQTPAHRYSAAHAINNQGQVAGRSFGRGQTFGDDRAVRWDTR